MVLVNIKRHSSMVLVWKTNIRMVLHRTVCTFVRKSGKNAREELHQRFTSTKATQWRPVVGLEIHAQIATMSKLFSAASTNFASPTNSCVSLFDCAIPGTMPVLNKECVEAGILTALAMSCKVNEMSMFERKHYFYADLPAGFQITQQKKPLASNGEIKFHVSEPGKHRKPYAKTSKIKQIQLEQDSGKSLHDESNGRSLIDLNRAGVPLLEFVFEPDLTDGEEAAALVKELMWILELLGTCSCKMEEGALRVDANVSISTQRKSVGVRTEIKNIFSVRAVAAAVEYEIKRQMSVLEEGGQIVNETRAWDAENKRTISMREKEERQDYRFMPETNLPPLYLHVNEEVENKFNLIDVLSMKKKLPQLPEAIRHNLKENCGLNQALVTIITGNLTLLKLFREITKNRDRKPIVVAKILAKDILTFRNKNNLEHEFFIGKHDYIGELIDLFQSRTINLLVIPKVLASLLTEPDKMPKQVVEEKNLFMISDKQKLEELCSEIIEKNPKIVEKYKSGKKRVLRALLGQIVETTNHCADMAEVARIMERRLN